MAQRSCVIKHCGRFLALFLWQPCSLAAAKRAEFFCFVGSSLAWILVPSVHLAYVEYCTTNQLRLSFRRQLRRGNLDKRLRRGIYSNIPSISILGSNSELPTRFGFLNKRTQAPLFKSRTTQFRSLPSPLRVRCPSHQCYFIGHKGYTDTE